MTPVLEIELHDASRDKQLLQSQQLPKTAIHRGVDSCSIQKIHCLCLKLRVMTKTKVFFQLLILS
uniref:Uncharacterized protein n=1 Tax=Solanum tuberosum TaxID=4113 RepID=M1CYS4_SOLTU